MKAHKATLLNYNDHANVGLPLVFRIVDSEEKNIGNINVDYDENSSPEYTGSVMADGKLINIALSFRRTFEETFDLEDDTTFDFTFKA